MKLIINECLNRIKLIKFFRNNKLYAMITLADAVYRADHLPYIYEGLSRDDASEIENAIKDFTKFVIEEEKDYDHGSFDFYNCNINPPQEYIDAMVWYESCSEIEKNHIDQIALWRSRPAVC